MTIGEFETDPIFFSNPSVIEYPVATYMLWIIFLVIMPVLLQNMLVRAKAKRSVSVIKYWEIFEEIAMYMVNLILRIQNLACSAMYIYRCYYVSTQ